MFPEHTTIDDDGFYKTAVSTILNTYSVLEYKPHGSAWTILASFFLSRKPNISLGTSGEINVISLATGTKCLPASKLSNRGESVHDSHAEVLARRSALRWFMEEILRVSSSNGSFQSAWITPSDSSDGRYALQVGVELNLYVSTVPCGDASMRFLASSQDEEMATFKNASAILTSNFTENQSQPNVATRGRDNYALLGVLRTKPGRADSPSTYCMSCSDKIARWNVLGIQGALGSRLLEPLYLSAIVIGEVPPEMKETVREDCERAFWARIGDINGLPSGYAIHKPVVHFSDLKFAHSRSVLGLPNSCFESLFWISDSGTHQVLINGKKRGVSCKYKYKEKSRSLICRLSLMELCNKVLDKIDPSIPSNHSYLEMKRDPAYQKAKEHLIGEQGPFAGWILTGSEMQKFTLDDQTCQSGNDENTGL